MPVMKEVSADVKILKRLRIAVFALFAFGALVGFRLFQFQILQHDRLSAKSEQQYLRTLHLEPKRGAIYDRNMKELAVSVPVRSLYANPKQINDSRAAATSISSILGTPAGKVYAAINSPRNFVWVQRKIAPWQAEKIASLNIKGLGLVKENKRYYPKRSLAAQILGFTGTDNKGLEGLEYLYDDYIGGEPSLALMEKDARGRNIYSSVRLLKEGSKGLDILLNIDETIQYIAEKELTLQVSESRARGGVAIVMDPHSGEVLALAQQPSFNPNSFLDYRPAMWKRNAVADAYEPGSTFKMVTLAAVLEEGLARPDEMIYGENGSIVVAGKTYHDVHKFRWLTVREVISKSSNICTIKLAERLGPKLLHNYVKKFGFGSKTGIELPGEASGLVRDVGDWSGVSTSSISIGYEVSVTPIQLITAYAAIANGGVLVQPRLVKAELKDRREYKALISRQPRRVVSEKTAGTITSILKEVVESGTGKEASIDGYAVAGKTGTARKYDPRLGAYSSNKYIASFVGYLPADKPRVAILVVIDEPKSSIYGGSVAAPAFSRIGSQVVRYLKIPRDGSLLRVTAPGKAAGKESFRKKAENLSPVKRMNRGFLELLDKARSSIMKPFEKKKSNQKINVKIENLT